MDTVNVTLRIEKQTKQEADQLFASLGLNFSTAVNAFLQKAIRTRSIPFEISEEGRPGERVLAQALREALISDRALERIGSIHESELPESYSPGSIEEIEALL